MFQQVLKKARKSKGLTQKEVSEKFGYATPQFVSNWERGVSTPPPKIIKKLEALYGVEFSEIYINQICDKVRTDLCKKLKIKAKQNQSV